MYCTSCGKATPENSKFCLHCGACINMPAPPAEPTNLTETNSVEVYQQERAKEHFHWKIAISTIVCGILSVVALVSASQDIHLTTDQRGLYTILGITGIGLTLASAVVSTFWTKVDDLSDGKKAIVWIPAIVGGAVLAIYIVLFWVLSLFGPSIDRSVRRAQLRDDIEKGVRRGLDRK